MKPTRREFLAAAAAAGAASGCSVGTAVQRANARVDPDDSPEAVARNDAFWAEIAAAYPVDREVVNLNNAGVSPWPHSVRASMLRELEFSNALPSYNLWTEQAPRREGIRRRLAAMFGRDPEEVAITRNTSEGLQTCQQGFDLVPGDEVLCTDLDYHRMIHTFEQRVAREAVRLVKFAIPAPCDDPGEIVELYRKHLSRRTRLILVSHVVSRTGQILPVREIVALGREHGVPVLVDGAHSFAHLDFRHEDLGCDYYATSLHKWLCAPHGNGMLFVARDKIGDLWPLMAARKSQREDIRKFEEVGTTPLANSLAIDDALTFQEGIGTARKHARLLFLRDRWARRIVELPGVELRTSLLPGRAAGFASFDIPSVDLKKLYRHFLDAGFLTGPFQTGGVRGVRVSPHVYTMPDDVDRFCELVETVARRGLPA